MALGVACPETGNNGVLNSKPNSLLGNAKLKNAFLFCIALGLHYFCVFKTFVSL
jgi:hypothetical protein